MQPKIGHIYKVNGHIEKRVPFNYFVGELVDYWIEIEDKPYPRAIFIKLDTKEKLTVSNPTLRELTSDDKVEYL